MNVAVWRQGYHWIASVSALLASRPLRWLDLETHIHPELLHYLPSGSLQFRTQQVYHVDRQQVLHTGSSALDLQMRSVLDDVQWW